MEEQASTTLISDRGLILVGGDAMTRSRLLGELTTPEIVEALAAGTDTVVVVAGSTEQHGPHLPTLTDTIQAFALGEAFAERINALLAPPIPVGCSDHHLGFAGTITLPEGVLVDVVEHYCRSLAISGFRRAVVLSSHGGNFDALDRASGRLAEAVAADGMEVIVLCDVHAYVEAYTSAVAETPYLKSRLPHADVAETSVIAAISPELVRFDRIEPGLREPPDLAVVLEGGFKAISPNGILGDPTGASQELGRRCITAILDYLVQAYRESGGPTL